MLSLTTLEKRKKIGRKFKNNFLKGCIYELGAITILLTNALTSVGALFVFFAMK